jgi:hypothetical protein
VSRLWVKLTAAFFVTALIAAGTVAWLSARATKTEFQQYVVRNSILSQPQWSEALVDYYRAHDGWTGAESVLADLAPGMGRGRGPMAGAGPSLAVADAAGRIVASKTGQWVGEQLAPQVLAQGVPLQVDGRTIGTVLNIRPAAVALDAQAESFLQRMSVSLFWAALLANALRYTPAGGSVTLRMQQEGQQVRFEVADTGPGIAAEDLPYVFERFYRADKSPGIGRDRRGGGAGLGLAIVRQLVNAQGGSVSVSSPPGSGATFTVTLPVAPPVSPSSG